MVFAKFLVIENIIQCNFVFPKKPFEIEAIDMDEVETKGLRIVSKASREHKYRLAKDYIFEGGRYVGQDPTLTNNHILPKSWEVFKQRCLENEANVSFLCLLICNFIFSLSTIDT